MRLLDNPSRLEAKLIKTTGYIVVGMGVYLIYKGSVYDTIKNDDIIDAEFEIIED